MIDYSLSYQIHRRVTEVIAASDTGDDTQTATAIRALWNYPGDYVFEALAEAVIDALHAPADTPVKTWSQNRISELDRTELALIAAVEQSRADIDDMNEGKSND